MMLVLVGRSQQKIGQETSLNQKIEGSKFFWLSLGFPHGLVQKTEKLKNEMFFILQRFVLVCFEEFLSKQ